MGALRDAKYNMERAETTNSSEHTAAFISSATALALIAIAERLGTLLCVLEYRNEQKRSPQ